MRLLLPVLISTILVRPASADPIQVSDILDSYGFSNGAIGSGASLSLNLWNDSTGARLLADNGDQTDLTISYNRTISGPTASSASGSFEYQSSNQRFRASHDFGSSTRTTNNPGSRITHTVDFTFANHLNVTGLDVDFSSLNTAGVTWEFSKLGYIVAGNPANNAEPSIATYDDHTTVNGKASGIGWFLVDSKATATQVG